MRFHAKTVDACWRIARRAALAYQRRANQHDKSDTWGPRAMYLMARNVADRIALKIRHGRLR